MTFDYDSVRDRLVTSLQSKSSWASILPYSVNRRLIDVIASGIADLAFYDEYLTRESKWSLAQNTSSLITDAKFRGYDVNRKRGATGNLRLSASSSYDSPPAKNISIPKYSQFSNRDVIYFATTSADVITTTDNYIDTPVVQGIPRVSTQIAVGEAYEELEVVNDSFDNDNYFLTVNGEEWTEIDDLNNAISTDKVFTLKNKIDFSGIDVQFGNDIFGKKLTAGDTVVITYIETLGIEGNISSTNIVTSVVSTLYDIDSDPVTVYCKNTETLDGGQDEDGIETIRTEAINTFQSGNRVISGTDYETKFKEKNYIQNAVVWGAYEYNLINNLDPWTFISSQSNVVHVSAYTPAGEQLSDSQKTELIAYVNDYKPPEDIIQFSDVDFIYLAFNVSAFISDDSYLPADVKSDIVTSITDTYALTARDFYQHIYDSVWKKAISEIDGVSYHNSYIQIVKYTTFSSAYVASYTLDIYNIQPGTAKVYIDDVLVGVDDASNGFTAEAGYSLAGSTINYNTGVISLTVASGLSGDFALKEVKTYYRTLDGNGEENLILKGINQIFKIDEISNIGVDYTTITGNQ